MNEKTEILNDIENELARLEGAIHGNDGDAISFLRGQVMKVIKMEESEHPSPALQDAVKETFGAIHLFAKEGHAVVSIEVNDKWIELMKEPLDSPFSHIIEPLGIQRKIEIA